MIKLPEKLDAQFFEGLTAALELKTHAGREALLLALENVKLLDNKQQDYGSRNISKHGVFGILVRMSDKLERIQNLKDINLTTEQRKSLQAFRANVRWFEKNELTITTMEVVEKLNEGLAEIHALFKSTSKKAKNESILDLFRDGCNYNLIGMLLEKGLWPNE